MKAQVLERLENTALAMKCKQIRQQWSRSESQRRRDQAATMQSQLAVALGGDRRQLAPVRV